MCHIQIFCFKFYTDEASKHGEGDDKAAESDSDNEDDEEMTKKILKQVLGQTLLWQCAEW